MHDTAYAQHLRFPEYVNVLAVDKALDMLETGIGQQWHQNLVELCIQTLPDHQPLFRRIGVPLNHLMIKRRQSTTPDHQIPLNNALRMGSMMDSDNHLLKLIPLKPY